MIGIWDRLFGNTHGCLYGKTPEQKDEFFRKLSDFATSDQKFFEQQYWDLTFDERREFGEWCNDRDNNLRAIKVMVEIIGKLLKEKHGK